MPIVSVGRDKLFEALGEQYSAQHPLQSSAAASWHLRPDELAQKIISASQMDSSAEDLLALQRMSHLMSSALSTASSSMTW